MFGLIARARDAQALLLAARERQRRVVQPILDFVPERGTLQTFFDDRIELRTALGESIQADAIGDVVVD
jgi:hypothetical protein